MQIITLTYLGLLEVMTRVNKEINTAGGRSESSHPHKLSQNGASPFPATGVQMKKEEWKHISGFPKYEVSSNGRVRKGELVMRAFDNGLGYMVLRIKNEFGRKRFYVHRLVMSTFSPSPSPKLEVNHIDHNKKNNSLENLEWVSHRDNLIKAVSHLGKFAFTKQGKVSP